jgi:cytochrome c oxidase subunit 2
VSSSIFRPLASPATTEYRLALFVFAITGAIFVVVAGLLVYTMIRFRRRPDDLSGQEPAQVYGSSQIEIAWTVIPILIVFVLVGVTARVIAAVEDASPPASAVQATVIGHQWWWEIRYPALGIVTANEIHIPVAGAGNARPTFFRLESRDVLHSLWVPELSGKVELIPNRVNSMWMDPQRPGTYLGACGEFCGVQHANMQLRIIVDSDSDFNSWAAAQQAPAENGSSPGKALFIVCSGCHSVQGTTARGASGPDLTHLMSRQTLGSGTMPNTPENLRTWVANPQLVKPGCLMPTMKLSDRQLTSLVAYLVTLK